MLSGLLESVSPKLPFLGCHIIFVLFAASCITFLVNTWEVNGPGLWDIEPTAWRIKVQLSLPGGGDHWPAHCPVTNTSYKSTYRYSWMNLIESKSRLILPLNQSIFPAATYNISLVSSFYKLQVRCILVTCLANYFVFVQVVILTIYFATCLLWVVF